MRKAAVIASVVALVLLFGALFLPGGNPEQRALEETRRQLRQQGFKVDLKEFNFSQPPEMRRRIAALIGNGLELRRARSPMGQVTQIDPSEFDLMQPLSSNAAEVLWKIDPLPSRYNHTDLWPGLRAAISNNATELDQAAQTILGGPYAFDLDPTRGMATLLPHLARMRHLSDLFAQRAVLSLHDHDNAAAWSNLLTLTLLVANWQCEPAEISLDARCACAQCAFDAAWQLLQTNGWTEDQLIALQHEWESLDFFQQWPEATAFARAAAAAAFDFDRRSPLGPPIASWQQFVQSPKTAWQYFKFRQQRAAYRSHGSYEDEKDALLFYRDRQEEIRQAISRLTWQDIIQIPGITNPATLRLRHRYAPVQSMINTLAFSTAMQGGGDGPLGQSVEAETRRRLAVTAIALERFYHRHGAYPSALSALAPEFLANIPADFIDGQSLRYHLYDERHFVLYSIGLNRVDDGGDMRSPRQRGIYLQRHPPDLVWPRPASDSETADAQKAALEADAARADLAAQSQSQAQWDDTAARQAKVARLFPDLKPTSPEPVLHGRLLSDILRNNSESASNKMPLADMLALRQVLTGAEPEIVTFEFPIKYDVMTNLADFYLLVDPVADELSQGESTAVFAECRPAANGDCLLVWHTIFEAPGRHALAAVLVLHQENGDESLAQGPGASFTLTHLCQFSATSATFDPAVGAHLRGKLPESNGVYRLEIKTTDGQLVKTINGDTTNSFIHVFWDLRDDRGNRFTNDSFDTFLRLTLPDSGRSQDMKGP